jgi:DNA-binding PadR family transcriptional regulator
MSAAIVVFVVLVLAGLACVADDTRRRAERYTLTPAGVELADRLAREVEK